jgi:hypothetical protein
VTTLILVYKVAAPITVEDEEAPIGDEMAEMRDTKEHVNAWEAAYKHPLLVSSTEVAAERDTRVVSYILPE